MRGWGAALACALAGCAGATVDDRDGAIADDGGAAALDADGPDANDLDPDATPCWAPQPRCSTVEPHAGCCVTTQRDGRCLRPPLTSYACIDHVWWGCPAGTRRATTCSDFARPTFPDAGTPCGTPGAFASCRSSTTASACGANGGTWRRPPSGRGSLYCDCPTGDADCPCTSGTQCEAGCIGDRPSNGDGCEALVQGRCARRTRTYSCFCFFGPRDITPLDDGIARMLCVD